MGIKVAINENLLSIILETKLEFYLLFLWQIHWNKCYELYQLIKYKDPWVKTL